MPKRMKSYEMIPDRFKQKYLEFYDELYHAEHSVIDIKTKELIALAVSLAAGCHGCFKGHVTKAVRFGATREEVGEAISIALAINAAAIVDRTDIANFDFDLVQRLWEKKENGDLDVDDVSSPPHLP